VALSNGLSDDLRANIQHHANLRIYLENIEAAALAQVDTVNQGTAQVINLDDQDLFDSDVDQSDKSSDSEEGGITLSPNERNPPGYTTLPPVLPATLIIHWLCQYYQPSLVDSLTMLVLLALLVAVLVLIS
jgi:hypothetical protein